jgi:ferric-dicitrate binding protein FerR (iron transport regulator)
MSSGVVKVKRAQADAWEETGMLFCLMPGDSVATGPQGEARIDFETGDRVYLGKDAEICLAGENEEIVLNLEKGEVYVEKQSDQKAFAVDTGFGSARAHRAMFYLRRLSRREYLLHVMNGEVECCERNLNSSGRCGPLMRAWLRQGERFGEGRKFDPGNAPQWPMRMRPGRPGPGPGRRFLPGRHEGPPVPGTRPGPSGSGGKGAEGICPGSSS